jgi:chromosome segregation ATPase
MTFPMLEYQRAERVRSAGEAQQRKQQGEASIRLLEGELAARAQEFEALTEQLAALKGDEPVLFGKDAWRSRVVELEAALEERRTASGQRASALNQLKIELAALSVQVQTEETQRSLVEQKLEATRAQLAQLSVAIREAAAALGAARPARPVAVAEASAALGQLLEARAKLGEHAERLQDEVRKRKDDGVRLIARLKQSASARQHVEAMVQSAEVAATSGREEALRQLAVQRRAAVERHVSEVLGSLEKSLGQVALVFIEPAREAMQKSTEPRGDAAAAVLAAAEAVGPVVDKLARELDPELLAQDAALGQIQREFCDVAASACRAAWS